MKLKFSLYLESVENTLSRLVKTLGEIYPYVSVLAQDSVGMRLSVSRGGTNVSEDAVNTKRGFVVRVHNGKALSEYSFSSLSDDCIDEIIKSIRLVADSALGDDKLPEDAPYTGEYSSEFTLDPETLTSAGIVKRLSELREKALGMDERLTDVIASCSWQKSHKLFISKNRRLRQSIMWTNVGCVPLASDGNDMKDWYFPLSGLCGAELIDGFTEEKIKESVDFCCALLNAGSIPPGEYDCICDPETTGMIVHEAFGHGVEMDMFVKNRALAGQYMNKPVASPIVTMHDGAAAAKECATFMFDDEGNLAQDTLVIDRGVLVSGYADGVSAGRLGVAPTGNGRRESFERKAYTRMTNTFFEGGHDKLEDMLASIKYGFMLVNPSSGMEDPKNWGIQCMVNAAREIKDGAFTGKIYSPIVLTGYVPDLLKSISMMSENVELGGSGYCGKGYKEWVKVSDGGPYIKARIRLG